jgi:membrane protease YdiL (CAAX protease family)
MTGVTAPADRPWRAGLLIVTATLALTAMYYFARPDVIGVFSPVRGWRAMTPGTRPATVHYAASAVLLALGPVLVARWIGRLRLRDLGLGVGRWREGLGWLAVGIPLAIAAGWIAASQSGMQAVYPLDPGVSPSAGVFVPYALSAFLYFGAWEVLFRGVLLFGLAARFGPVNANVTQSALAVTAHFGRALNETFSALPGSLVFGAIALRTRSVWYVALIHWTVGMSMEWFLLARHAA